MDSNITTQSTPGYREDTSYFDEISNIDIAQSLLMQGEIKLSDLVEIALKLPNDAECGAVLRQILLRNRDKKG